MSCHYEVDVCKDVSNTILEQTDSILVRIEIAGTVPISIEVHIIPQIVVGVDGDQEFDATTMRLYHEVIEEVRNSIFVGRRQAYLETGGTVKFCSLLRT